MGITTVDSGNILVQNFGKNPAVNFNFMLRVEGLYDLPCRAVRAFQRENEYELIQEGGVNDYVHMRRKPISKPFTFQVERYVGTDILDPLSLGTDLVLPVILYVSRYRVYGDFVPIRMYTFTGCTVMAKEYGELNAEKSGLLVETTTIAYREMLCVENVAASFLASEPWEFKDTEKKGQGTQSAIHYKDSILDDKEPVKSLFSNNAKKWMFNGGGTHQSYKENQQGTGNSSEGQSAQAAFLGINGSANDNAYAQKEVRKAEMEKNARKWPAKRSAADVAAFLSRK